jgi:short-subunit dehydrogenase
VEVCAKIRAIGAPDILINNAGLGRWLAAEETSHEEAVMMTKLPYLAAFHLSREFIPGMMKKRSGYILNVNSPASLIAIPGASTYSASRWALRGFTESLKIDLRKTGIKVCHCVFGEVSSNYFQANPASMERIPGIASKTMRPLTPKEAANIIVTAIEKNKSEVTAPFMMAFYRFCLAVAPWSVKALVKATGWQRG